MTLSNTHRTLLGLLVWALAAAAAAQGAWTEAAWRYPGEPEDDRAYVSAATDGAEGRVVMGCAPAGDFGTRPLFLAFESPALAELGLPTGSFGFRDLTATYRTDGGDRMPIRVDRWFGSEDGSVLFAGGMPAQLLYAWIEELGAAPNTAFSFWVGGEAEGKPDLSMSVPTTGAYEAATDDAVGLACFEGAG
jgi:hypothetical protein